MNSIFYTALQQVLFSSLGAVLLLIVFSGLALISLYFINKQFRVAYNLFIGPSGRQAEYRSGKVHRSGYAFDEDDGRWRYVQRNNSHSRNGYTRYIREKN